MANTRHKNANWNCGDPAESIHHANTAVLMDIRDELQAIKRVLQCQSFISMPYQVGLIRKHTQRIANQNAKKRKTK